MEKISRETAFQLERRMMDYLDKMRQERGMNMTEWGRRSFGPQMTQMKMHFLVCGAAQPDGTRKPPKRINLADFICLCQGLDVDPAAVFSRVYLDSIMPWSGEIKEKR